MSKKYILIAEDDLFLADMIERIITEQGLEARSVENGEEAVAQLVSDPPRLLLLDLLMPRMDGFEVLKQMREKSISCPVIILSNISDKMNREKCHQLGAENFFVKSDMDIEDLWPIVEQHLKTD